jgi:hypothetical protein
MKMKKQKRSIRKSRKSSKKKKVSCRRKSDDELKLLKLLKLLIAQGVEEIPGSPMFIEGWWPGKGKERKIPKKSPKKSPKRNRRGYRSSEDATATVNRKMKTAK